VNGRVMIFTGHQADRPEADPGAHLYCSSTGWSFGPLFDSADDCKEFLGWLETEKPGEDARAMGTKDLYSLHARWLVETGRVA